MTDFRKNLPQLNGDLFLTDGGIETTLIFHEGLELPYFASFDLLKTLKGRKALRNYFDTYAHIATQQHTGLILESATWRANPDWGTKLGYSAKALETVNRDAIEMLVGIREEWQNGNPIVISGCVGPRSDGYSPEFQMTAEAAEKYHSEQIAVFSETETDIITAITMTYSEEAIGVTRAAKSAGMPVAISFTVETDGRLPSGQALKDAIIQVDAETGGGPAYYMINCAHPTHFSDALTSDESWLERIHGLRANASKCSHAELDEATELDDGNPVELGQNYVALKSVLKNLNVMGGCCGTDHRHIEAIGEACRPLF